MNFFLSMIFPVLSNYCLTKDDNTVNFVRMEEQLLLNALEKIIESGALENIQEPGKQTLMIYGLLIALTIALARIFLINGWAKRGIERFFALEEKKLVALTDLNGKVLELHNQISVLHQKLYDMLQLFHANRKNDVAP